jgi:hypothetical protein
MIRVDLAHKALFKTATAHAVASFFRTALTIAVVLGVRDKLC